MEVIYKTRGYNPSVIINVTRVYEYVGEYGNRRYVIAREEYTDIEIYTDDIEFLKVNIKGQWIKIYEG